MLRTDRKKDLQTATFKTVRAMRSVLYSAYQVHALLCRDLLTIQAPSKRLERVRSRGEGSRGPWGLTRFYEHSKRLLRTSCSGQPASLNTAGGEAPDYPPPSSNSFRRPKGGSCGGNNPGATVPGAPEHRPGS
jgi:hypothetical protein